MSRVDTLPQDSILADYFAPGDFMDTFSASLKGRDDLLNADIRVLADHILNGDVAWMNALLSARDRVVRPLGLKTTDDLLLEQSGLPLEDRQPGDRVVFFKIYQVSENEILLGEDDWHQDFRLSIYRKQGENPRVYASTCCKRHNFFGHVYLALIMPFHKKIASSVLDNAVETKLH